MPFPGIIQITSFSSTVDPRVLSPGVWATCPGTGLITDGQGLFNYQTFETGSVAGITSSTFGAVINAVSVASTVAYPNDHVAYLSTSTSTAAAVPLAGFWQLPFGPITPGGNDFWFEANVITATSTQVSTAGFVGIATQPFLSTTILSTVAGFAGKTVDTLSTNVNCAGFYWHSTGSVANPDAIFGFSTKGISTVLAQVLTASTNYNPANLQYTPATPPGVWQSVNDNMTKLGLHYVAAINQLQYFVNGNQVAAFAPTAGLFDVTDDYGPIVVIGGNAAQLYVDFVATASQWQK